MALQDIVDQLNALPIGELAVDQLVFTSKGYMLASQLEYLTEWQDTEDFLKFHEGYLLDGEVVKNSCHAYSKKPLTAAGEAATL